MKYIFFLLALFYFGSCTGTGTPLHFSSDAAPPSHQQWDKLVKEHVTVEGWVDYPGFIKDSATLNKYLQLLSSSPPADNWARNEKMAYWINAYNAFTVKLIVDHYPVESIKDINPTLSIPTIRDVFTQEFFQIGGKEMSLNDIEHNILRNMDEPRIHYAVNCASVSCPKLRNEAYTAAKLDAQLTDQAKYFLNRSGHNKLSPKNVELSKIFKWFQEDFTKKGSLIDHLNKYATVTIDPDAKISYKDYNWKLNSIANSGRD